MQHNISCSVVMADGYHKLYSQYLTTSRFLGAFFRRHGVVAASSPGIASQDALQCEPTAAQCAVGLQGLHGILRTRGREAACGRRERRDEALIEAYGRDEKAGENAHSWERADLSRAARQAFKRRTTLCSTRSDSTDLSAIQMKARCRPSDWPPSSWRRYLFRR